ncbi:MAG TPA: methyltransferase domain-containing protein [Natronosporangium sp.]|nr:methyltransferase domain-containing protein [Natronosporangium sp.]
MAHSRVPPQSAPRTAVVWQVLSAELARYPDQELAVVDVGGGTGGFAVPLAEAGHRVTVVDPSPDALAALARRAAEAGVGDRIRGVQGDGDRLADLVAPDSADLVLCHSLLEVVEDPAGVVQAIAAILRPEGAASVLVANQVAAVLARAMSGQLTAAAGLLRDPSAPAGSGDTLQRRFDVATVAGYLTAAGLTLETVHGVRVLTDLLPPPVAEGDPAAVLALETELATRPPYRDIAAQLHLLARRPAGASAEER